MGIRKLLLKEISRHVRRVRLAQVAVELRQEWLRARRRRIVGRALACCGRLHQAADVIAASQQQRHHRIVDGRGRTVRTVGSAPRGAGETPLLVRTDGLAPGLYFVVAEAGALRSIQPLTVAR